MLGASLYRECIMATTKPRITISLKPNIYATLKRMSELGKQPMSSIVTELLESVHEPLMRVVAMLDAAATAPKEVKEGLKHSFEAVERDIYGSVGYSISQIDWLTEQMKGGGGERASKRAAAPTLPGTSNPHNVIRGSGLRKANEIKDLKKRVKGVKNAKI
jgi:predicted CopG family antitoxin